ncbi:MAG TPA: Bax inhibitor-1/YccA family protein [Cyclobacteriaceae bacterium]|nr:Bax inhibitor-1/YccA family protein [Cyclobacteriaceae bacterium]
MDQFTPTITAEEAIAETQRFMTKVYSWMSFALIVTGFVAMYTAQSPALLELVFGSSWTIIGLIIVEIVMVGALAGWVSKMSAMTATLIFILYSALNGVTLSGIFLVYTSESIASTFFISAATFGAMSIYGYTTKSDLSKWGSLLFMGLIGLVIAGLVNLFMRSSVLSLVTSCFGVLIFVGLTAYDTQKIKNMNIIGNEGTEEDKKEAIMGALTLYLDFINLFVYLLRLFGRRK